MDKYLDNGQSFHWGDINEPLNSGKTEILERYARGNVLDIGCAVGRYTDYVQRLGHQATGLDPQQPFIKMARSAYPNCAFVCGTAYKVPFETRSFDTVVLFDVLEHLDDLRALKEAARVGQRLIISVPHSNQPFLTEHSIAHHHYMDMTHLRTYTPKSLNKLLTESGYKVVTCHAALPVSIHGLAVDYFAHDSAIKSWLLRVFFKVFRPQPDFYSTVLAVADVK